MMRVYYASPWIPAEWIPAHALQPCGVWAAEPANVSPRSLPISAGVCAFAESVLRLAHLEIDSAVVFATTCDQMRRSFDALAGSAQNRNRIFLFNVPATWQTPVALRIYRAELERLGRFLVALGGQSPTPTQLRQIMACYHDARRQLLAAPPHCSARQFVEAVASFLHHGTVNLPDSPRLASMDPIPVALVGGPLPAWQWDLLDAIEASGLRIVLNASDPGERNLLPQFPLDRLDADPLTTLARGYMENSVGVFQRPNTRLYAWLKKQLTSRAVRGIILWYFVGCDLWRAEASHVREAFGLPLLTLGMDETASASPRNLSRLQAFWELLQ